MDVKIIYFAAALFLGMMSACVIKPNIIIMILGLILLFGAAFANRRNNKAKAVILLLIFCLFGMFEYTLFLDHESKFSKYRGKIVDLNILILEEGIKRAGVSSYVAESKELLIDGKIYNYKEKILFKNYNNNQYKSGDIVKARGNISGFIGKRNFGDNDISLYYKSKGIYNQFTSRDNDKVSNDRNDLRVLFLYNIRNRISKMINVSLPKEEAALLNAVIIGDKHWLGEEERDDYTKAGLAHLLSISGLHVAFIAYMLREFLKVLKINDKAKDIICSLFIIYYVLMIGAPPPALRSLIMMFVLLWGKHLKKEYDMVASSSFAFIIMLLLNPLLIHNRGFIISFGCIYSIAFLYEPIYKLLRILVLPLPIRKAFALSLSIQLGIGPILIYYFNYLSLVNILVNIIAVPLTFIIIAAGFSGVIIGAIFPILGIYIFSIDYYFIHILSKITKTAVSLPFSGIFVPSLSFFFYLLYYGIVIIIFFRDKYMGIYTKKRRYGILILLSSVIFIYFAKYSLNDSISIVFLDVGQGDSSLITTSKGKRILIDGGGSPAKGEYYYDVGSKVTVPALLKLGVWKIDTIMVSHIHEDHLEGLIKVIEAFKVEKVILPRTPFVSDTSKKFTDLCGEKGIKIYYAKKGDRLLIDKNTKFDILFPEIELLMGTNSDENNNSLVGKLTYKKFSVLFTGDIEKEAESLLLGKSINADVVKIPHHGSNTSSSLDFINMVSPDISIISVGKNSFGHPSKEALKRIEESSKLVLRTDQSGAIAIKSNGNKIYIKTVRKHNEN